MSGRTGALPTRERAASHAGPRERNVRALRSLVASASAHGLLESSGSVAPASLLRAAHRAGSRLDAQPHRVPQGERIKIGADALVQLRARLPRVLAPDAGKNPRVGNLPSNAPDRITQVRGTVAELEIR